MSEFGYKIKNISAAMLYEVNLGTREYFTYGYVSKNPKEKRISIIGTEQFCLKIKNISENVLNVHCSISVCHRNESSPTRALGIAGGKQVKKFLDWMYQDADLFIQRKFETYKNIYCS